MDFKDLIKQISDRIVKLKDNLPTEEATKNALIMPFINTLGYDVFNPLEVLPEMTCDIGTKKGEKIDYAILKDGIPIMLVECKHWQQDLSLHDNQLLRYFNVSKAKFGVLTNGIIYKFYTDLEKPNLMDEKPFLEINMLDLKEHHIEELKKFHKSYFNIDSILSSASELKYMGELKNIISQEFANPSPEFVKYLGKQVYDGQFMPKIIDQFTTLVKRSINSYINDLISDRLKAAIKDDTQDANSSTETQIVENETLPEGIIAIDRENGTVTTQEEVDAYNIVRSILRANVDASRITYKDFKSYFVINLDGKQMSWICRLSLKPTSNRIGFPLDKSVEWIDIDVIDDIFKHSDRLISSLKLVLKEV